MRFSSFLMFREIIIRLFSFGAQLVQEKLGGGQNLERPIFRKFETSNIEITKDE